MPGDKVLQEIEVTPEMIEAAAAAIEQELFDYDIGVGLSIKVAKQAIKRALAASD